MSEPTDTPTGGGYWYAGTMADQFKAERDAALAEVERLRAERRDHLWLLHGSRLTLDGIAEGREGAEAAAEQAQRIVDHTGHAVTDEPPHTLVENDRLRAELDRRTDPELARRVGLIANDNCPCGMCNDLRAAADLIDGETT